MNTNILKKFAQQTRIKLMEQISSKLEYVLNTDSPELREKSEQVNKLKEILSKSSKQEIVERVSYTWFNRLMALRFMDVNDYQPIGTKVVTPNDGYTLPEILDEAKRGHISDDLNLNRQKIFDILDGKIIVGDCALKLPQERLQELGGRSKVLFGLRPEACTPSFESAMINGKADFVENTGNLKTATLKLATGESFYLQDSDQGLQMEDIRGFNFDWQNVCLFDAESGENLAKVR